MAEKAKRNSVLFRPHFKTHQSRYVGDLYREAGIKNITVSSVRMARYFSENGWKDITIAFPFNPLEYQEIDSLSKSSTITITVTGPKSAKALAQLATTPLSVMIKIDTGYNRSGTRWDIEKDIIQTLEIIDSNKNLTLNGLLSHSGNTYHAKSKSEINEIFRLSVKRLNDVRRMTGRNELIISVGDTPAASLVEDFTGVDEVRPGNFVFFDVTQATLGSCRYEDIAVAAACPVVDIRKSNGSIIIYGGGVHLSKEFIMIDGQKVFGRLVNLTPGGWDIPDEIIWVSSLSQVHGVIMSDKIDFDTINIGDLVGVLPVHSCLTANLLGGYITTNGKSADHMNDLKYR